MSMSKKKDKKTQKRKNKIGYKLLLTLILVGVSFITALGIWACIMHENSVLDIYSDQQDAYVQLVLDQINIQPEKTDEEIITNILGSLDTSNRKYWTLSKNQMLLFVKDVMETNRYKGFTTPTYFESESAAKFMEGLQLNHVTHDFIEMDEDKYVASGVVFEYNGDQYKICLLTNETVILDNNAFLSSKIGLYIYMGLLLVVILVVSMSTAHMLNDRKKRIGRLHDRIEKLNSEIEKIEAELDAMNSFHSRWNLYGEEMMDMFMRKLEERKVRPVVLWEVRFEDKFEWKRFLRNGQILLDERVLRFSGGKNRIYLVFVKYQQQEVETAMNRLKHVVFENGNRMYCDSEQQNLWDVYQEFLTVSREENNND